MNNHPQAEYDNGFKAGFQAAIEILKHPDREQFNAGITSCIHASEWASWLENNFDSLQKQKG
jgi:hypothetical protein